MGNTNIDYWKKILQKPLPGFKYWFEQEKKYLRDNLFSMAKVLDIGCGDGRNILDIIPITKNIVGVDYDEQVILDARRNLAQYIEVKIVHADARNLPFNDKTFDFVISLVTFVNLGPHKEKVLCEMKRVLKDNGFIIISVFSEDAFEERMKMYKTIQVPIKEIKGTTVIFDESLGANTSEQFSKKDLKELFKKVDLKIVDIKKVGIAYLCKLTK